MTELRKENAKYFRLSDGSIQVAEYDSPVHFFRDDKWVDYDNTLTEVDSEETNSKDLVNNVSDTNVRLSKKTNGKKFVRVEKDGYKLSWYYSNANKVTAQIKGDDKVSSSKLVLDKLTSTVIYSNVYEDVDFEYVIVPSGLKENIILKSNKAQTVFESEYKSNGLIPEQPDNQTVILKSEAGDIVYTIKAPFMEDSNGAYSPNVSLKLKNVKNNKFNVEIYLDSEWLSEKDRAYPVLVDPVLKTAQDISAARSAFVSSSNPDKCYLASGTDDMGSLYVGNISGFGQTESYIKFTSLPTLGIADKVVDARLYIGLRKCELGMVCNIKRLTNDWDPYTVTWNNRPGNEGSISDYLYLTEQTDTSQFQEIEITDLVRGWYSGDYPNYGLSLSTDKTDMCKAWFYSIHYTGYTSNRPIMTVTYRNMSGYENYWSYTDLSAGRSGTASVNNYNGNFIFTQPLMQNGGNLMPVELALVYNSNGTDAPYSVFQTNIQTNYHIYMRYDQSNAENGFKYYLNDADGTRHWFYFEDGNTSGKDEDGLGLTLYEIAVGSDSEEPNAGYKIVDADENVMYFDSKGNIIRIRNSAGISSTVQYDTIDGGVRIKSITDGAGRIYTFGYAQDSPGLCTYITDPAGRTVSFSYYRGLYMWITFPDSKVVSISRSSENWLVTEIIDIDGNKINISYDSTAQHRVSDFSCGTNDSILEKYSFVYKQNETKVTDKNYRTLTYQFNDWAQTTGIISEIDGTAQFFEYENGNLPGNAKANKVLNSSRTIKSVDNYIVNPGFNRDYSDGYEDFVEDWNGVHITMDQSQSNFTGGSLSICKETANQARANVVQTVSNMPGGIYTASCYINTGGVEISGEGNLMVIEVYEPVNGNLVSCHAIEKTVKTDGWERRSVTFDVQENCSVRIALGLDSGACGTVWFDDLQLEKSSSESSFNLIENPSALNDKTSWNTETIVGNGNDLSGYPNYFYRNADINDSWFGINQVISANVKNGDVFTFGAWVKADSAPTNNGTRGADSPQPAFALVLHYYNANGLWAGNKRIELNPDVTGWQFVSGELILPQDSPKLCLELIYFNNVDSVAMTGAFCYKEEFGQTYTYDDNGNVVSASELANVNSSFAYYGNQMAQMLNPSGSKYLYNYNDKKQLYNALSSSGQEYSFFYDDMGNLTQSEISARKPVSAIESGKSYILVNAYSGLAMDSHWKGNAGDITTTYQFSPEALYQQWQFEAIAGNDSVYKLKAAGFEDRYLDVTGASAEHGTPLQIWNSSETDGQKFKLVRQSDNTFVIYTAVTGYTRALDGQLDVTDKVVQSQKVKQADSDTSNPKASQKWYLYPVEQTYNEKIAAASSYTESKNFLSTTTDESGNTTSYDYNEQKGTLTSTTDPKGNTTAYTYDPNSDALISVTSGDITNSYNYENDRLKFINVNDAVQYNFEYDSFGRTTAVKIENNILSENVYNDVGLVSRQIYGNGNSIDFNYDSLDRVTKKIYNDENKSVQYLYGNNGLLSNTLDTLKNSRTKYIYDLANRLVGVREYEGIALDGNNLLSSANYIYGDKTNNLIGIRRTSVLGDQSFDYIYGDTVANENPDAVYAVDYDGTRHINYVLDELGRRSSRTLFTINKTQNYTYAAGGHGENSTTTRVESVTSDGVTISYTYDENGNITAIKKNGETVESYTYDAINQLKSVTRNGVTTEYTYLNGNILSVTQNGETVKSYTYGDSQWADLLTNFNGQTITYDAIGNPVTYLGKNMTWQYGRRLAGITDGDNNYSYAYDADGNRISKTVNGVTTQYIIIDGVFVGEKTGDNQLVFLYDESGGKYGFVYNGETYYYDINLQGDVTGIYDSNGQLAVEYSYDEWGKLINISDSTENGIGTINPIRYRGYYYDAETGFYLTGTRYYDPEIGRFINADGEISDVGGNVLGYNLFAYCFNNPVNMDDPTGQWPKWIGKAVAVVAVAAVVVAAVAVTVSTFGAGSVAGVAAISAAVTIAAKATEVAVLQVKKSKNSSQNTGRKTTGNNSSNGGNGSSGGGGSNTQKSSGQVAVDVTEALFDNGLQIIGITPFTKAGSIGFNHILNQQVSEIFGETTTLSSTLSATGGKVVPYAFAVYAWCKTTISIFSDDPVQRSEQRGYTLK
ncbi:MAG: DNRLRE domain-containing protein [Ruminiclostridium sp.]|nr:DNRLRE domain-containing protein [Ruminiclostridium sp.]